MAGKGKRSADGLWAWIVAALVFLCVLALVLIPAAPRQKNAPKMLLLGDSIYATGRGGDSAVDILSELVGTQIQNDALGGTSLSRADQNRHMDQTMDSMSLISLSKAILAKDFSVQKQAYVRENATEYFDEVVAGLEKTDFGKVEILFLGYGMNDYQNGVPIRRADVKMTSWTESAENPGGTEKSGVMESPRGQADDLDEYTFEGALRRVLTDLKKEYPKLRIVLLSPPYSFYVTKGKSCEELDFGGGLLEAYVDCEREVAAEFGIDFVDLYHGIYEIEGFEDWKKYTVDGVHPNETGKRLLAQAISEYLTGNMP